MSKITEIYQNYEFFLRNSVLLECFPLFFSWQTSHSVLIETRSIRDGTVIKWTDLKIPLQSMKCISKWCWWLADLKYINFTDWKCSYKKSTVTLPPDGSQWRGELTSNWKFTISFNMCRYTYYSILRSL